MHWFFCNGGNGRMLSPSSVNVGLPPHPPPFSLLLRSCVRVSALCRLYIVPKIMMECRKNILFQKLNYGPGLWDCISSFVYFQFLTGQNPP